MHANNRQTGHNDNIQKVQEQRWKEHFEEILNRPDPNSRTEIPEANINLEINTDEPFRLEITINNLKNN